MKPIEIRSVLPGDMAQLQQISRQTFEETFAAFNSPEDMAKYLTESFSVAKLTAEHSNPDSAFYFATLDEQVIGYLKLNFGQAQTELQDAHAVEIERIYVTREFHGQNVGKLLFDKALQIARDRNVTYIWLGVWEENKRALSFYTKNGFKAFGTHIFKLGDDEQTDILMKLPIHSAKYP